MRTTTSRLSVQKASLRLHRSVLCPRLAAAHSALPTTTGSKLKPLKHPRFGLAGASVRQIALLTSQACCPVSRRWANCTVYLLLPRRRVGISCHQSSVTPGHLSWLMGVLKAFDAASNECLLFGEIVVAPSISVVESAAVAASMSLPRTKAELISA